MEGEEETLALFDVNWFCCFILSRSRRVPPLSQSDEFPVITADSLASELPPTSSFSRQACSHINELTPSLETPIQSLIVQTTNSGKVTLKNPEPIRPTVSAISESRERRIRRDRYRRGSMRIKHWGSRSLSDLEFEELKGFMDLGFTFSDAEATDPWLISIVPGLQRLRSANGSESPLGDSSLASETTEEFAVMRPYLSEAWEVEEEEEERVTVLKNWGTPCEGEGIDLKDRLRFWARAVASAVL